MFATAVSALLRPHPGSNPVKSLNCNLPSINTRFNYLWLLALLLIARSSNYCSTAVQYLYNVLQQLCNDVTCNVKQLCNNQCLPKTVESYYWAVRWFYFCLLCKVSLLNCDCNLFIRVEHFCDLFWHYLLNSKLRPSDHKREASGYL